MSKVALITDTHWGVRGDSQIFAKHISEFYSEQFFPYLIENNIKHVIHLGDALDRRKFVNFVTAKRFKEDFIFPLRNNHIDCYFIIGNHDTYFKNTNDVNCMNVLFSRDEFCNDVKCYSKPGEITIDGTSIALMPWICSGNYDECIEFISNTKAQILFGHLDISGFQMYKGIASNHEGMDRNIFSKFDLVCSGHFHHKSHEDNIHYLGAPYEMTWSDYNDPRGFHIFDTSTRELEFIQNKNRMFIKIWYDDSNAVELNDVYKMDFEQRDLEGKQIKIIVVNKDNPYWFDMYLESIYGLNPDNVSIVDDNKHMDLIPESEIISEAEDTLTILNNYVDKLNVKENKELKKLLTTLYNDALTLEA